jgi:hypothetical protein
MKLIMSLLYEGFTGAPVDIGVEVPGKRDAAAFFIQKKGGLNNPVTREIMFASQRLVREGKDVVLLLPGGSEYMLDALMQRCGALARLANGTTIRVGVPQSIEATAREAVNRVPRLPKDFLGILAYPNE